MRPTRKMRKPDEAFYKHVLSSIDTNINTSKDLVIFIDDKLENVEPARNLGMHGIVFNSANADSIKKDLIDLCKSKIVACT